MFPLASIPLVCVFGQCKWCMVPLCQHSRLCGNQHYSLFQMWTLGRDLFYKMRSSTSISMSLVYVRLALWGSIDLTLLLPLLANYSNFARISSPAVQIVRTVSLISFKLNSEELSAAV